MADLLRLGVASAAAMVLAGAVVYLARHGAEQPHLGVFMGEPSALRSVRGIVSKASSFSGRGIIQLGLLILIATPIARVLLSLLAFARDRDATYVVVTTIVLALLLLALTGRLP